jgi:hypothetical protein
VFKVFLSLFQKKRTTPTETLNSVGVNVFVPRTDNRGTFVDMMKVKYKHVKIDTSKKGNHDCISCGEDIAYYWCVPYEYNPKCFSLYVRCECGINMEDFIEPGHLEHSSLEDLVRYCWNEHNDFEARMRELQYTD